MCTHAHIHKYIKVFLKAEQHTNFIANNNKYTVNLQILIELYLETTMVMWDTIF